MKYKDLHIIKKKAYLDAVYATLDKSFCQTDFLSPNIMLNHNSGALNLIIPQMEFLWMRKSSCSW